MGYQRLIFIFLLMTTTVTAATNFSYLIQTDEFKGPGGVAKNDRVKDQIEKYCQQINTGILWTIGLAMVIWITEPTVKKKLRNVKYNEELGHFMNHMVSGDSLPFLYKWIGLGLLFMSGYMAYVLM